ncbi:SGNH/GDSL hydrolase family protein [Lactiplantibacillus plantarum]|uniref:SGNH/GDSL hydrolase family protein n=1 Tax=Lactiplantibacillus plantarum TaxID=1590 RepID=UPI000FF8DBA9|nr:SGNH/GDSL hydrolase family protein [Lactiplantibacillus plantarum]QAR89731.1 SGNH/GDSL hydrolase family protein [Lactiplantibacillus plantarum]
MAKTLEFTIKSPRQIKQGDTETTFTFICKNDGSVVDLTKATSITAKIGNASGYLRSQSIATTSLAGLNPGWFNLQPMPDLISGLPAGDYQLEIWVVDQAGTSIYPSDAPLGFTITNNIENESGASITTITFDDFVNKFNDIVAKSKAGRNSADIYEANKLPDYNSKTQSIHFSDEYAFISSPHPIQIVNESGEKDFIFDIKNQTGFILIDRFTGVIQTKLSSGDFETNYVIIGGIRYNGKLKLNGLFTVDGTYYDDFESSPNYNIYFSDTRNAFTWNTVDKKIMFHEANVNYGRKTIRIADQTLTYSTEGTYFIYYNKSNLNFEIEQPPLNVSDSRFQVGFFNTYNLEMYLHVDPKCIKITPKSQSNYDLSTNDNLTFFGDSITYGLHASDSSHSYPSIISKNANINVYNEGVSSATWQNGSGNDAISLVTRSKSIDFTRGNTVVLFSGTNDFAQSLPIGTLTDTTDKTMLGAINLVIKNIYSKNPVADILLILPMWRARINDANTPVDIESTTNSIGQYLKDYNEAIMSAGEYYHFPVLDLYHVFGVNKLNYTQWLADGLHPNDAGYAKLANIIGNFIARS